jgi:hypothetical protein
MLFAGNKYLLLKRITVQERGGVHGTREKGEGQQFSKLQVEIPT